MNTPPAEGREQVTLTMSGQEAHDLHHAISMAVLLLQQVGARPGAPLTTESEGRLTILARRLDHERRHHGAVPNPNVENRELECRGALDALWADLGASGRYQTSAEVTRRVEAVLPGRAEDGEW